MIKGFFYNTNGLLNETLYILVILENVTSYNKSVIFVFQNQNMSTDIILS